jgi:7-keto-8-aminopelargonate synthetase-like enzyme
MQGIERINFASYDYLNLNRHPLILEAVDHASRMFGTSVSASRISAGERRVHAELESALADLYGAEAAIAFVSGHAGVVSTLSTLMGPKDLILYDALSHNCIVMGAKLSGAARRAFPHNDDAAIEAILEQERGRFERVLIVTEGLFSMDGDGPDLRRLIDIKQRHAAILMVDDAHGLGVLGRTGRGLFEQQGVNPGDVDLWVGTLSKALVSCGGYVAGSSVAVDVLKHHAPGFVYSVGLPAGVTVAATTALQIMLREPERVALLQARSLRFHEKAKSMGVNVATSWGYGVIPVIVGDALRAIAL